MLENFVLTNQGYLILSYPWLVKNDKSLGAIMYSNRYVKLLHIKKF